MSGRFEATGGARIGWLNATWPFARLAATPDTLQMSVSIFGDYHFTPDTVTDITRYTHIPFFGWGIQIHHCVPEYPTRIIFWSLGSPDALLAKIRESGFQPQASGEAATCLRHRGVPFRWAPVIFAFLVWNALIIGDVFQRDMRPMPGPWSLLAIALVFAGSMAILKLPQAQQFILKPGRSVEEIRPLLKLFLLVSGGMIVPLSVLLIVMR